MTAEEATAAKEDLVSTMVAGSTYATPEENASPMFEPSRRFGRLIRFSGRDA